jgi:hypothetical protein
VSLVSHWDEGLVSMSRKEVGFVCQDEGLKFIFQYATIFRVLCMYHNELDLACSPVSDLCFFGVC